MKHQFGSAPPELKGSYRVSGARQGPAQETDSYQGLSNESDLPHPRHFKPSLAVAHGPVCIVTFGARLQDCLKSVTPYTHGRDVNSAAHGEHFVIGASSVQICWGYYCIPFKL